MTAVQAIAKNAKYWIWILAAGTAFVVLKLTLLSPPSVRLVTVANRDLTAQVYGNGTVEAKVVVDVSSKITGRIVALFADQGDHVQRGRLVAKPEDEDVGQQATQGKRRGVWTVQAGKVKWNEIALEIEDRNSLIEVVSGLAPGEAVAVAPAEQMRKFQDGMKVKTAK